MNMDCLMKITLPADTTFEDLDRLVKQIVRQQKVVDASIIISQKKDDLHGKFTETNPLS